MRWASGSLPNLTRCCAVLMAQLIRNLTSNPKLNFIQPVAFENRNNRPTLCSISPTERKKLNQWLCMFKIHNLLINRNTESLVYSYFNTLFTEYCYSLSDNPLIAKLLITTDHYLPFSGIFYVVIFCLSKFLLCCK